MMPAGGLAENARSERELGVLCGNRWQLSSPWLFVCIAVLLIAAHASLLRLPYFWDEAGYYIPAARDLLGGSLIPHCTPSNAHPPLVMAWLALAWKILGQ